LLTIWKTSFCLQRTPIGSTKSIERGAKQLVVESTQSTSDLYFSKASLIPSIFVLNSSPTKISSITIGLRLAAVIALRQVF
jgi:hypothetical protein